MKKLAVSILGVCLFGSALASVNIGTRRFEYIHNNLSANIRIDINKCYYSMWDHMHFLSNYRLLENIKPNSTGDTWGKQEKGMPGFAVSYYDSPSNKHYITCPVEVGDSKSQKWYRFGTLKFKQWGSGDMKVGVLKVENDSYDHGLVIGDLKSLEGNHHNGHFDIGKINTEAKNVYVCVYEENGSQPDEAWAVTINMGSGFLDTLTAGDKTSLSNGVEDTRNIVFQNNENMACSQSFGSFSTDNEGYLGNTGLTITVKNLSSGLSHSTQVMQKVYDAQDDITSYRPALEISTSATQPKSWTISPYHAAVTYSTELSCPSGFCPSGYPKGQNDIYIIYDASIS
ncbi:hypothetical protein [Facilibium subflavum]|uniref:hypothetical protein n=1 Tax=Facilibium subflavum TaxID=2219058 RepID=UPI000E64C390|nr:hypothetical protein [Facilibium subflavum]